MGAAERIRRAAFFRGQEKGASKEFGCLAKLEELL